MMKTNMNNLWALLGLCTTLTSCSDSASEVKSPYPSGYFEKQIAALTHADVAADVASAVANGDRRFLVNLGFGGSVPGVTNWSTEMREKYGTRILDGTGDMVFGVVHEQFKKVADNYAERYNQLLLKEINKAEKTSNPAAPVNGASAYELDFGPPGRAVPEQQR
jgi:hypothetical protein